MALTVTELARQLDAEVVGGSEGLGGEVGSVQPLATAGAADVAFVTDPKHESAAKKCAAAAIIVARPIPGVLAPQLVVANVNAALIATLEQFAPKLAPPPEGIDPTARLGAGVRLGDRVSIGPYAVIGDRVEIGSGTVIGNGCTIGEGARIGADCRLDSYVTVYHRCTIGDHVIVQSHGTIGAMGFGYAYIDGRHRFVPHNGGVVIEDFVEIGANTCIDRAKFGNTIIGAGTKIDNLVQIGHNVVVGKGCLIAAQVGVAGSCRLGDGVVLAGQVGLADNIEIGAGTMVGAQSGVMSSVPGGQKLAWTPAVDMKEAIRIVAHLLRLPKLAQQLKRLTAKVEELEAANHDQGRG
ncbi:MAG: UDP-3-O-(3-hydroxymyristoyl)glucosamine N-acyltransferase [Planctomycetes bacterium]|nr:UDP-3-O-(3-hydroxymyristoyl)glucosamine N-acyltransferase [Planctomycetota bacterium]